MSGERIVMAMSGGVDSSVAAALLQEQGYDVVGLFMRSGVQQPESPGHKKQGCCSLEDAMDARRVAGQLGVPFFAVNFEQDFGRIIDYFVAEYERGRTPNPCVQCNRFLKFGKLLDYAREIGAGRVATGHYARVVRRGERLAIARPHDRAKDQSYVLFPLSQQQLEATLLPLGEMTKSDVRAEAARRGLPVVNKADSQEICFVPDNRYGNLLAERRPGSIRPGPILDTSGQRIGEHAGHQIYTVGQRRGLGQGFGEPVYVVETRPADNAVVVGAAADLEACGLVAGDLIWSGSAALASGETLRGAIQVRSRHTAVPATARGREDGRVAVVFDEPVRAITPGQAAVFYDGDTVLFGGFIDEALHDRAAAAT